MLGSVGVVGAVPGGGGLPAEWTPADLGAVFWVRGDLGVTVETGVSAWADQSGAGRHLVQATTTMQPAIGAIAGKPALSFDGADDNIAGTTPGDWTFLHDGSGSTLSFVIDNQDLETNGQVINTMRGNSTEVGFRLFWSFAGVYILTIGNGSETFLRNSSATLGTGPQVWVIRFGATSVDVRLNGSQVAGLSGAYTGSPSASAPQGALKIGDSVAGGGNPWLGLCAEVMAYDRVLTSDEVTAIEAYATARYSL